MWCVIGPQGENEEGPILRDIITWRESRTKAWGVCVRKPQTNCFDIEMLSASIDICCSRRFCFLLWIKSGTFLSCKFSFQYIFLLVCRRSWKQNTKAKLVRWSSAAAFHRLWNEIETSSSPNSSPLWNGGRKLLWENHNYIVQLWFRQKTMIAFYHGSTLRNQIS